MKNALIIFIKTPIPGLVKTRLQPDLTADESAQLYSAFLKDLDHKFYMQDDVDCWYAVSPENFDENLLNGIVNLDHYFLQEGQDLGERMSNAFEKLFIKGYEKIVLIGSDLPSIQVEIISQANHGLDTKDCIIGPSKDGGYYLIALSRRHPEIFENLPWSTSDVLKKTIDILVKKGLRYALLSEFEDIDTHKELISFYQNYKDKNKNDHDFPTHTWEIVRKLYVH